MVVVGASAIDQSTITGESMPVEVTIGSPVYVRMLNTRGALEIDMTKLAHESTLARIIELVKNAQDDQARIQRFVDEFEQK